MKKLRSLRFGCRIGSKLRVWVGAGSLILASALVASAQQPATSSSVVPTLVKFSGVLNDANGKPLTSVEGVTFALYTSEQGGSSLWLETQNVTPDKSGHYSVMLGSTTSAGLPADLFASGEVRWVGVQPQGQPQEPRVMLLSVPYALKAGDAATVGGLPPSAFVLAAPAVSSGGTSSGNGPSAPNNPPSGDVTGSGTANYVPLWTSSSSIGNSVVYQSGTGSKARVGINTATPASTLDVKGGATIRGLLSLPSLGTATASKAYDSQPMELSASAFNTGSGTAIAQNFQWQAEPVGNNSATTSGTLNLLFATGSNKLAETGLNIASNGQITFAKGQTFPLSNGSVSNAMLQNSSLTVNPGGGMSGGGQISLGGSATLGLQNCSANQVLEFVSGAWTCTNAAVGTITAVNPGTGLSGGGNSGSVTLTNTGMLSVTAGTGIGLSGNGQTPTISNTGVLGVTAGTGISISSGQTPSIAINTSAVPELSANNSFTGNNSFTSTTGNGLSATTSFAGDSGVVASNTATTGSSNGLFASTYSASGSAVAGVNNATASGTAYGIYGQSDGSSGIGVFGIGSASGVRGSTGAGNGVTGYSSATSGTSNGVSGSTNSPAGTGTVGVNFSTGGYGVYGQSNGTASGSTGVYGVATASPSDVPVYGVYGVSSDYAFGAAVAGTGPSISGTGKGYVGGGFGVWGDASPSGCCGGVLGTGDDSNAIVAVNESGTDTVTPALYAANNSSTTGALVLETESSLGGSCTIDISGNLGCTGSITAHVAAARGQQVELYGVASPENWFEDFGSGKLSAGSAKITLDPTFASTIDSSESYHVFVTPNGDCKGLYVASKSAAGFEVRELGGGASSTSFDYRIVAKRRGYQSVRMKDVTDQMNRMEKRREEMPAKHVNVGNASAPPPLALEATPRGPEQAPPVRLPMTKTPLRR